MKTDIIEVIIAIFGAIITAIQIVNEYRKYRVQKKREKNLRNMLDKLEEYMKEQNNVIEAWNKLQKNQQGGDLLNYVNAIPGFIVQVRALYIQLLKLEEMPLAVGFEYSIFGYRQYPVPTQGVEHPFFCMSRCSELM